MGAGSTAGNAGQLMSISGTIGGVTESAGYTYDNLGRLVTSNQASNGSSTQRRFAFDRWGNRTGVWDAVSGGNQIQSIALQQSGGAPTNQIASVTSGSTLNYVYDAAGNLINDGVHSYGYDSENRIVSVDGGSTGSYAYDHQNRRYKKTIGSTVTDYVWEGSQVVAEHNGSTRAVLVDYVSSGSRMIATVASGSTQYFLSDRLSTRVVLDTGGAVVGRQGHLPFGEEFGGSGTQEKHHFTNYEKDSETGLNYAINRGDSPNVGRFLSADPYKSSKSLIDPQRWNRYSYTRNDPVNATDRLGMDLDYVDCEVYVEGGPTGEPDSDSPYEVDTECELVLHSDGRKGKEGSGGVESAPGDLIDTLIKRLSEKLGEKLNDCETELLRKVFDKSGFAGAIWYVDELAGAKKTAVKFETRNGGPQDDNRVNAKKHCIWACELSRRFDEEISREWTDAHECGSTSASTNMDYHNNFIGRWLGTQRSSKRQTCEALCAAMPVQVGGTPNDSSLFAIRP